LLSMSDRDPDVCVRVRARPTRNRENVTGVSGMIGAGKVRDRTLALRACRSSGITECGVVS
jgi:hypothetical protein